MKYMYDQKQPSESMDEEREKGGEEEEEDEEEIDKHGGSVHVSRSSLAWWYVCVCGIVPFDHFISFSLYLQYYIWYH